MSEPVCDICRDTGVLRGPGPKGTTVKCICQRPRPARALWVLLCLLAAGVAGSSGWSW